MASVVQEIDNAGSVTNPASLTFGTNVTSGNLIVVTLAFWSDPAPSSVTVSDTQNTYTLVVQSPNLTNLYGAIYYTTAGTSGPLTVTLTLNGGGLSIHEFLVAAYEVSGVTNASGNDSAQGSGTQPETSSFNFGANDILFTTGVADGASSGSPCESMSGSGWTTVSADYGGHGASSSYSTTQISPTTFQYAGIASDWGIAGASFGIVTRVSITDTATASDSITVILPPVHVSDQAYAEDDVSVARDTV